MYKNKEQRSMSKQQQQKKNNTRNLYNKMNYRNRTKKKHDSEWLRDS